MEKLQYDIEGQVIRPPVRKCSPCLMQCWILVTVAVAAFAGTLFYQQYYHPHRHVAFKSSSSVQQLCKEPHFDMTYVKFYKDSIMAISEDNGSHLAIVHYRDQNKRSIRRYDIADLKNARLLDRLLLLLKYDVSIPDDIEQQILDSSIGSQVRVRIHCRQDRLEVDFYESITSMAGKDLAKYANIFEVK